MKLFDTNIVRFGGLNQCQRLVSLSIARTQQPLFSQLGTKKYQKINFCIKTESEKY
jgi:hypothetical protein